MLLNTFAPPFKLVGGYFIAGIISLLLSIFAFFKADFNALSALNSAGFFHLFFVGFVISIIIGALYQLTSVILEEPFFSIKGAFLNLFIYIGGALTLSYGMISSQITLIHVGGGLLFVSLLLFGTTFFLSFLKTKKRNLASISLLLSSLFLLVGITLGFCLVLVLSGILALDFTILLYYHIYFVLGFVFFIVVGVASVLIPMFALAHDIKFIISKISLGFYILAGILLYFSEILAIFCIAIALICFVTQVFLILKKRVRKAYDYWNLNIFISLISLLLFCLFLTLDRVEISLFLLIFGFLYPFIIGHIYKIAPFLIWYHYISPFVGKTKVPLLDEMILKKVAYTSLMCNVIALFVYPFFGTIAMAFMLVSVLLVATNMIHFFKFTKFGVKK